MTISELLKPMRERVSKATPEGAWIEEWRDIPGCDGYQVSDHGNVRSILKKGNHKSKRGADWRLMKPYARKDNRITVSVPMGSGGKYKHIQIYYLVMLSFVGPRPEGMDIAHLNGNRQDNRLKNLKYCSRKENDSHKILHGTSSRGEGNSNAKLQGWQVAEIKYLAAKSIPQAKIAALFDIDHKDVWGIANGGAWSHTQERTDIEKLIKCVEVLSAGLEALKANLYSHESSLDFWKQADHFTTESLSQAQSILRGEG